jgi:hypothetical protein
MAAPIIVRCPWGVVWWGGVKPRRRRSAADDLATIPTSRAEAGS